MVYLKLIVKKILFMLGVYSEDENFREWLKNQTDVGYEACHSYWNKQENRVHGHDTNTELIKRYASRVVKSIHFTTNDIVLCIGCGDGQIDEYIVPLCKEYYGIDFAETKIKEAKDRNPQANYWTQSFLDRLECGGKPNIIYSFSVMQYCKPDDVKRFIVNQVNCRDKKRDCIIAHLAVPDIAYAKMLFPFVSKQLFCENIHNIRYLPNLNDGSCWHNIQNIREAMDSTGVEYEIEVKRVKESMTRSNIFIKIKKS